MAGSGISVTSRPGGAPVGARDRGLTRVREIVGQASRSSG